MTVSTMPATLVAAPPRTPLPHGLFSTVTFRAGGDTRWYAGVQFEQAPARLLAGVAAGGYCTDPAGVEGLPVGHPARECDLGEATAFTVVAGQKSSAAGGGNPRAAMESLLASREERAVEHALWTGVLGNTPNLRDADVLAGAAVSAVAGVGLLEEWLATEYGAQGIIHMPRMVAASGPAGIKPSGQTLRTVLGTPVAAGSGYDGTGPDGTPATGTARWVYATPAITGYRSDVTVTEMFDRGSNDLIVHAERDYLLMFDNSAAAAALIDLAAPHRP